VIALIPTRGQNVLGRHQAGDYGFFYGVYYYPGDLDDFMSFRFKAGTLQVSNAPIPSICRLICDQSLKSTKENFASLQSLCFSHLVLPRSDHAAPVVQTPHLHK